MPDGRVGEVYEWFRDDDLGTHTENRDYQGGWASQEAITDAPRHPGQLPTVVTGH